MPSSRHVRVLIIGAGPAGYTAAIYAARAGLAPVLLQGLQPGGQLTVTADVENYPGFAAPVTGPALMDPMAEQARRVGAELVFDIVTEVRLDVRPFVCRTDGGEVWTADALIVATGAQARRLGREPSELVGRGISGCATCDGAFFRGRRVAVVGGGNVAVEDALHLAGLAAHVTLIHRRDRLRAEKVLQERLLAHPKITVAWNRNVEAFHGEAFGGLTGLRLRTTEGAVEDLEVDGAFIAIGHDPATELFRGRLDLDEAGFIRLASWSTRTSVEGVFAAGDVADPRYRQAVTAAGMGCMAALEAERFLAGI
jgi:thioredoxin reductase (NADPH)